MPNKLAIATAAIAGAALAAIVQERRIRRLEFDTAYGMLTRSGVEARLRWLRGPADVVFLDLDHIHDLNSRLGHTEVDRLIREAFQLRETDIVLVGRWYSGDEIVIVVKPGQGAGLAARLLARLHSFGLSATIAVEPAARGQTVQAARKAAERVEQSKTSGGRNRVLKQEDADRGG